jgi:EAL domain-containing protein (putative c-di-GMP-specific phosphodiesterase class I)
MGLFAGRLLGTKPSPLELLHARSEATWSLVAQDGGDVLPLTVLPCPVGRHPAAVVRIIHATVSLNHAEFRQEGEGLVIVDMGSRNGTFVNGKRVSDPTPVAIGDLVQFGAAVFRLQNRPQVEPNVTRQGEDMGDLALALAQFEKLVSEPMLVPVYQPIVSAATGQAVAYEALARSTLFGLDKPALMFKAAEVFRMEAELSRLLRQTELAKTCAEEQPHLFLNTHPTELADLKQLILSLREIRGVRPTQPITLEVHEAAAADLNTMKMLRLVLDDLKMTLAYDDFGAGQARLAELVEARPEYVKFDRKLIRQIDQSDRGRQSMVQSLVTMCQQLGIQTLAEGVETEGEATACRNLGFNLMQGFYFGKPEKTMRGSTVNAGSNSTTSPPSGRWKK